MVSKNNKEISTAIFQYVRKRMIIIKPVAKNMASHAAREKETVAIIIKKVKQLMATQLLRYFCGIKHKKRGTKKDTCPANWVLAILKPTGVVSQQKSDIESGFIPLKYLNHKGIKKYSPAISCKSISMNENIIHIVKARNNALSADGLAYHMTHRHVSKPNKWARKIVRLTLVKNTKKRSESITMVNKIRISLSAIIRLRVITAQKARATAAMALKVGRPARTG
jgi:hypothetical protein